jgi:hypothetical protein
MPPIVRIVPRLLLLDLKRLGVIASGESLQEGRFMIDRWQPWGNASRGDAAVTSGLRCDTAYIEGSDKGSGHWTSGHIETSGLRARLAFCQLSAKPWRFQK